MVHTDSCTSPHNLHTKGLQLLTEKAEEVCLYMTLKVSFGVTPANPKPKQGRGGEEGGGLGFEGTGGVGRGVFRGGGLGQQ